jgi:1-acyl-sn-glycerol-3-phosphate acyltransferase
LRQTYEQGKDRLSRGFWIVIFPEGTRVRPGVDRPYQSGGAWLAVKTGAKIVPVAHNAGLCWPRNAFLKRPGVITVKIGAPIDPAGMSVNELNASVERWIKAEAGMLLHGDA